MNTKRLTFGMINTLLVCGFSTIDSLDFSEQHIDFGQSLYAKDKKLEPVDYSRIEDEIYKQRFEAMDSEVPFAFNQLVKSSLERYLKYPEKSELLIGLAKLYQPIFDNILLVEGVPQEFAYLPIVESAVDLNAVSHKGAKGLWQFMPGTAELYGLRINEYIDERKDPEKSTKAAAQYLKDLHKNYDNWLLALAAYNCGPGNVNKAIRRSGGKKDFWEIRQFLPRETRYYVPRFIAANYLMNYYTSHNMVPMAPYTDFSFDHLLVVDRNVNLYDLAEELNVSIESIKQLNPALVSDVILGAEEPIKLKVPYPLYQEKSALTEANDAIAEPEETINLPELVRLEGKYTSNLKTEVLTPQIPKEI